ncbi:MULTISPECIES: putative quinol monooxygenase [unclassified Rhizobium]|uniref:putative quinol monooxygenase n=1 Tax=unclassified Rhizobium TaxID=2613769 RepID=UPI00160CA730|nr:MULTISPECIES: putative quinol monooxygenase [unclassified Rhizobium]MBB3318144.1 quinol monooxygenase YgiN [Rhizobium sp. BK181]MBB3544772.1 quinol monooxygenase YgiN [Rhizobium sp. BK399]MCS3743327.1 quinol monooxygenase YgiN [Rhizobium sp. BK661]MCS4096477.1 quinol monooxygenase YgiN [Rhizobium sp. BK176]
MTVSLIATLTARPETRDELLHLLVNQVEPTRSEQGCIDYNLHVDAGDPCVFVFYENWKSQADLDAHMEMQHLKPLLSEIDRLLAKPIDIWRLLLAEATGISRSDCV